MASQTLWGSGPSQFIFNDPTMLSPYNGRIITMPSRARVQYYFIPDSLEHLYLSGIKERICRGYFLYVELFFNLLRKEDAENIRDVIWWAARYRTLFKPHTDFSLSYTVSVNREEGWNFDLVKDKQDTGYEGILIIRGTERLPNFDISETTEAITSDMAIQ